MELIPQVINSQNFTVLEKLYRHLNFSLQNGLVYVVDERKKHNTYRCSFPIM